MNWAPDFATILAGQTDGPRPRPPWGHQLYGSRLPAGTYECVVQDVLNEADKVEFDLQPVMARSDVDLDECVWSGRAQGPIHISFWPEPAWKLEQFLDHCGIPKRGTVNDRIALAEGRWVGVLIIGVEYEKFDAVARTVPGRRP